MAPARASASTSRSSATWFGLLPDLATPVRRSAPARRTRSCSPASRSWPRSSRWPSSLAGCGAPAGRWRSASCSPASWATSPTGCSASPRPCAATSSTSCGCRTCRSSTSPTSASTSRPACIILQALRGDAGRRDPREPRAGRAGSREPDGRPVTAAEQSAMEQRTVTVPDGLAGERVDAALARMFGFSRSRAAELIGPGAVRRRRQRTGNEVRPGPPRRDPRREHPRPVDPVAVVPQVVEGIKIVHDDDALVVIDKPVGVAVHPSPGWAGPTVVGHLAAAGFRIATSGASERQGDRAAARRRHLRGDGDRQVRVRLLPAEERVPAPHGRQDLPRAGAGAPRPAAGHRRRADRAASRSTTTSSR